jgi:hypothetical protein
MHLPAITAWQPETRRGITISSGETSDPKPCEVANPIALGVEQRDDSAEAPLIAARVLVVNEDLIIERRKKVRKAKKGDSYLA